jgi:hypothetical protein
MAADSTSDGEHDAVKAITETIEGSVKACFVLMRAPLQIYGECLKVVASAVAEIADKIRLDEDTHQQ